MTTTEVISAEFRDNLHNGAAIGGGVVRKSVKPERPTLSLEVVKGIWRKYPASLEKDIARVGSAAVLQPSSRSNALGLNLGEQTVIEASSGRSPSATMSHAKPEDRPSNLVNNNNNNNNSEPGAPSLATGQGGGPAPERAADNAVLARDGDTTSISPVTNTDVFPPRVSAKSPVVHGPSPGEGPSARPPPSPSSASVQPPHGSGTPHLIQEMRSLVLDGVMKTAQSRFPDKAIEHEQINKRLAEEFSDSDLRQFVQMGSAMFSDLRRTGLLEDLKRKHAAEDDEDGSRTRRRLDSPPRPKLHISTQGGWQSSPSANSVHSSRNPPVRSNSLNAVPPRAPKAMLAKSWKDEPARPPRMQPSPVPHPPSLPPNYAETPSSDQHLNNTTIVSSQRSQPKPASSYTGPPPAASAAGVAAASTKSERPSSIPQDKHQTVSGHAKHTGTHTRNSVPNNIGARVILAKVGLPSAGLLNASFDVDDQLMAAVRRWADRSKRFNSGEPNLKLCLTSIPTHAAEKLTRERPPSAPPSAFHEDVSRIDVVWPPPGTLYVSLNQDRPEAFSWSQHFFRPSSPPLDISSAVVPGTNAIQFVQLEDHSQTLFVILAIPPSQDELEEVLALHSRNSTWRYILKDYKDRTHVRLRFDSVQQR